MPCCAVCWAQQFAAVRVLSSCGSRACVAACVYACVCWKIVYTGNLTGVWGAWRVCFQGTLLPSCSACLLLFRVLYLVTFRLWDEQLLGLWGSCRWLLLMPCSCVCTKAYCIHLPAGCVCLCHVSVRELPCTGASTRRIGLVVAAPGCVASSSVCAVLCAVLCWSALCCRVEALLESRLHVFGLNCWALSAGWPARLPGGLSQYNRCGHDPPPSGAYSLRRTYNVLATCTVFPFHVPPDGITACR